MNNRTDLKGAVSAALILAGGMALSGAAVAECSAERWQDCSGKAWVDGHKMETPLGERWWPNALWGEGDDAGSTNW